MPIKIGIVHAHEMYPLDNRKAQKRLHLILRTSSRTWVTYTLPRSESDNLEVCGEAATLDDGSLL